MSSKMIILPKKMETISKDTEVTIRSILESYNQKGKQFAAEGIHYSAITLITTISNLYLIKKYGTNCFMYGDQGKDENFLYGGFVFSFSEGQLDQPIERIIPDMLAQINSKNLLLQIYNFLNCIKHRQQVIIIPLLLQFADGTQHANMLIYRQELNTIEHFEPHGSFLDLRPDYGDKITRILGLLVEKINEINTTQVSTPKGNFFHVLPSDIRLVPSNEVCIRGRGLQAIQQQLRERFSIEGPGYCQMWSLLFAELALLNPTMTSTEILEDIYALLERQDGPVLLSSIIRGYVSMLGDEISLYLSQYINNAFTIENISYTYQILPPYAMYLSELLSFIVYMEVNVDTLLTYEPTTLAKLHESEEILRGTLSDYFRLKNELKELLVGRKENYSIRGEGAVDTEIIAKLTQEFYEYQSKKMYIKRYIKNKIFQNYLRSKQEMVVVAPKKPKYVKVQRDPAFEAAAAAAAEEIEPSVDVKRGRKTTSVVAVSQRKSTRTTKGGKKYKKTKKSKKNKKGKKSRKYKR